MHLIAHLFATALIAPYAALAVGFLLIGHLAGAKGLWEVLDRLVTAFDWMIPWGVVSFVLLLAFLGLAFCFQSMRVIASASVAGLGLLSLAVLVFYRQTAVLPGELLFLLPCIAAVAISVWQVKSLGS